MLPPSDRGSIFPGPASPVLLPQVCKVGARRTYAGQALSSSEDLFNQNLLVGDQIAAGFAMLRVNNNAIHNGQK